LLSIAAWLSDKGPKIRRHVHFDIQAGRCGHAACCIRQARVIMKVLLPIDESPCSARAIETVVRDFDPATTEVCVVHAIERNAGVPSYLAFAEGPTAVDDVLASYGSEREREKSKAMQAVRHLLSAGFKVTAEVRVGSAPGVILECATEWHPDRIVMGSHERAGLPRLLFGSVAGDVRRAAPCAVDVVGPHEGERVH
jgi:nucleotide-binding universal stress UspA family protein